MREASLGSVDSSVLKSWSSGFGVDGVGGGCTVAGEEQFLTSKLNKKF